MSKAPDVTVRDSRPCFKCGFPEYPSHHDSKMPQWEDHPYEADVRYPPDATVEALQRLAEWPCQKYNPPHDCGRITGDAPLPCGPCTARAALGASERSIAASGPRKTCPHCAGRGTVACEDNDPSLVSEDRTP